MKCGKNGTVVLAIIIAQLDFGVEPVVHNGHDLPPKVLARKPCHCVRAHCLDGGNDRAEEFANSVVLASVINLPDNGL